MYVQGVFIRKAKNIRKKMCGFEVSSLLVSDAAKSLNEEIRLFMESPLCQYCVLYVNVGYPHVVLQKRGGSPMACILY